jgi:transcriptional regulator with XRE-family HTH domain
MRFRFDIGGRGRAASRLIGDVRSDLIRTILREKLATGLTQQKLAKKLGLSRSKLNRSLMGKEELTLRSVSDLAWALDKEVVFELREPSASPGQNHPVQTSTLVSGAKRMGEHIDAAPSSSGVFQTFFAQPRQNEKE